MRHALAPILLLSWPALSAAQGLEESLQRVVETQIAPIISDIDQIIIDGPKYLALRLPALQAAGDFGSQMDLHARGQFSLSVGVSVGALFNFQDDITDDFLKIPTRGFPPVLPLPSAIIAGRVALTSDLELGVRVGFVPDFEYENKDFLVHASTRTYAARGRYRLHRGKGAVPTLVSVAEVSYFTGFMDVGQDYTFEITTLEKAAAFSRDQGVPFDPDVIRDQINRNLGREVLGADDDVEFGAFFAGAPVLGWDIYQLSVEQRAVWDLAFFHPYLGLGLDFAGGHVDSGVDLTADVRVSGPGELVDAANERFGPGGTVIETIIPTDKRTLESEPPRPVGGRLIGGFEFDLGNPMRFALEAQLDVGSLTAVGGFSLRYAYH